MRMRFSANLSMLYPEHEFLDRFAAAARDGFTGVEFVGPYNYPKHQIAQLLRDFSLRQVLFNLPPGDWAAGERGLAGVPGREAEFAASVDLAIEYAVALECSQVHCMAGNVPAGVELATCEAVFVRNLSWAAPRFAEHGIVLLIEPINPVDMPGYVLTSIEQAEAIMDRVGSDNLLLQMDFYHRAMVGGELVRTFERLQGRIAHVQVADVPGRHEPGTGAVDYPAVFMALERLGYDGWVGAEYRPIAGTSVGVGLDGGALVTPASINSNSPNHRTAPPPRRGGWEGCSEPHGRALKSGPNLPPPLIPPRKGEGVDCQFWSQRWC